MSKSVTIDFTESAAAAAGDLIGALAEFSQKPNHLLLRCLPMLEEPTYAVYLKKDEVDYLQSAGIAAIFTDTDSGTPTAGYFTLLWKVVLADIYSEIKKSSPELAKGVAAKLAEMAPSFMPS